MSFFDKFKSFTAGPSVSDLWNHPQNEDDIRAIFDPKSGPQMIYKHSFTCHICTYSLIDLEKQLETIKEKAGVHFIDVRSQRPLSNLVAELSGVQHQSPQGILLHKGEAFWHDSHAGVRSAVILEALAEL